jgi:hypothetical protein
MIPFAPIRVPVLSPHLPEKDPDRHLASRPWIQFFLALRDAIEPEETVALAGQAADVAATTLVVAPPSPPQTLYRVAWYVRVTTAASVSSSVQVTVGWTDGGVVQSTSGAALTGNTTTTQESGSVLVSADAETDVTYAVAYTSVGTDMAYALSVVVEAIP